MAKKKKTTPPPKPQFTLTVNVNQAAVLIRALDFFSRIGIGQIEEVENMLRLEPHVLPGNGDAARAFLDAVKKQLMGLDANQSWGIFHATVPDHYKEAWDLQQVIRHKLSWTLHPEGGIGISFDEPLKSGSEPLATMEVKTLSEGD